MTEDHNSTTPAFTSPPRSWRSPSGVTEDRNTEKVPTVGDAGEWRSPSGVTEDRNDGIAIANAIRNHVGGRPPG
ncbi:hypothetical protein OIE50_38825 [Streptomyces canus]|uniref:hypothetical protein n=1 Tax=Streptomyces canus TaxID=58343 RepID=UPI003245116E